jgi:cytochrome c biogenesis protein CcdA
MVSVLDSLPIQPSEMTLAVAGWMGILASLHACAVVRLPILAAYMAGTGASRQRALLLAAFLAAGLVGGTIFLGMTAMPLADGVHRTLQVSKYLFWVLGACLIAVGVPLSGLIDPQLVPERCRKVWERMVKTDALGALLLGLVMGLLQTPACPTCRAELLAVVGAVPVQGSSGYSLVLLVGFAAGQSLIAWCVAALAGLLRPSLLAWLRTRMCSAELRARFLAGNMLVVLGIYFIIVG